MSSRRRPVDRPLFIGFAGRMGAGKTSAAQHISATYGMQYFRYSLVLRDWFAPDGSDRSQLQRLGWDVMDRGLQMELNKRLIERVQHANGAAIDGLRHLLDFESLTRAFGESFQLVFLDASPAMRFERLSSKFPSVREFQQADEHPVEANIDSLKVLSAISVVNDGSLTSLYSRLDAWMTAQL